MSHTTAPGASKPRFPVWIKLLLAASVVLMAGGLAMPFLVGGEARPSGGGVSALSNTLSEGGTGAATGGDEPKSAWSPAVFRLGFSFFVAFVAAYALRTVFKLALIFAGFVALILFGLQYAGLVDVKWGAMEGQFDDASGWISSQFASVKAFVTGYLPSGGAAAVGFVTGARKGG